MRPLNHLSGLKRFLGNETIRVVRAWSSEVLQDCLGHPPSFYEAR
jgi:hypothetical protein